jgi:site-specific DNA-methyltransferase (adenine-specific)
MGAGSTVAAACAIGYVSIGVEADREYFAMAERAVPKLATLDLRGIRRSPHEGGASPR